MPRFLMLLTHCTLSVSLMFAAVAMAVNKIEGWGWMLGFSFVFWGCASNLYAEYASQNKATYDPEFDCIHSVKTGSPLKGR